MKFRIKKKRPTQTESIDEPTIHEVGRGEFAVTTVNRHDGSIVIHRFRTAEEAQAQYARNVAMDQPLAGLDEVA